MKFTPVFERETTNIPLWEITDIPLFDKLPEEGWIPAAEFYNVSADGENILAYKGKECHSQLTDDFYQTGKELLVGVRELLSTTAIDEYDITNVWPERILKNKVDQHLKNVEIFTGELFDVWRDAPGYRQSIHLDNFGIIATLIFNIKDNPENSGTKYYKDFSLTNELEPEFGTHTYQAPTKAGTGVLHINTPWTYHEGWNFSDGYREIGYWNLTIE